MVHGTQTSKAILLSTSKGNYLRSHVDICHKYGIDLEFHCKPGARFGYFYPWLLDQLARKVREHSFVYLVGYKEYLYHFVTKVTNKLLEL